MALEFCFSPCRFLNAFYSKIHGNHFEYIYIYCVCVYLEGASEKQRARTTRITRSGQKKVEIPGQKDGEKDKGCRAALNNLSVPYLAWNCTCFSTLGKLLILPETGMSPVLINNSIGARHRGSDERRPRRLEGLRLTVTRFEGRMNRRKG